jgi:hypothetical protein
MTAEAQMGGSFLSFHCMYIYTFSRRFSSFQDSDASIKKKQEVTIHKIGNKSKGIQQAGPQIAQGIFGLALPECIPGQSTVAGKLAKGSASSSRPFTFATSHTLPSSVCQPHKKVNSHPTPKSCHSLNRKEKNLQQ